MPIGIEEINHSFVFSLYSKDSDTIIIIIIVITAGR